MKNWCVNPYYTLASIKGRPNLPCCVLNDTDKHNFSVESLRNDFDRGIKSEHCKACWTDEELGVTSKRQKDNRWISWHSNKSLNQLYKERNNRTLLSLQYKASNLCNLACKTCHSIDSTRWYAEDKHFGRYNKSAVDVNDHRLILDKDITTIRHLEILGGEPFLDSAHFNLLERLIDAGNTDLHLIYTTNGQQMPSLRLSKLLSKFAKVQINLSIDGKDKVFDYMRYPGKWETLEEVLKQLQQTNWKISAYATLSNLNVFYFDELLEWIVKNFQLSDFNYQFVYEPTEMAVNVMPVSMKEKIQHKFLNHKLATFLKPVLDTVMFPCKVDLIDKLKTTVKQQDTFRKQDPKDFVPEIVEYLY